MTRHVLLSSAVTPGQGRWEEAFPALLHCRLPRALPAEPGAAPTVLWVDAHRLEWLAELRHANHDMPVVAISLQPSAQEALAALEQGAKGYCHALAAPELLHQIALVVRNGGLWIGPELMSRLAVAVARVAPAAPGVDNILARLTQREREVAQKVAEGASNKEIARQLDITPRTVKAHLGAVFEKLRVRDRLQLIVALKKTPAAP